MNIHDLIAKTAEREEALRETRFVAPCVRGGEVRTRVGGLVQTFRPEPSDFEGWGVFTARGTGRRQRARLVEEADLPLVAEYLALFPVLRVRLVCPLVGATWLAYPVSEGDMAQRFGAAGPVVVHLVTEGRALEVSTVRYAGRAGATAVFWFEDTDRRADPLPGEQLRDALREVTNPAELRFAGLTPEMRAAYTLAAQQDPRFAELRRQRDQEAAVRAEEQFRRDAEEEYGWWDDHEPPTPGRGNATPVADSGERERLRRALQTGGGTLYEATDRGEYYLVEWQTADGVRHTSAIAKGDLTVISSGICLSGEDRNFDLQSLVGVIERRE